MAAKAMLLLSAAVLFLGTNLLTSTEASKILFALPIAAKSHSNVITALAKELANRGHTVKVITPFAMKNPPPNYTEIINAEEIKGKFETPKMTEVKDVISTCFLISRVSEDVCKATLSKPEVQELIKQAKNGVKYDLVVVNMFYSDCAYALAHIFDAPMIVISPAGSFPVTDSLVGNPALPSFMPNIFSSFSDRMSFLERGINSFMHLSTLAFHHTLIYPKHNAVLKELFGDDFPSIQEIEKRVSLVLLNSHHSILFPRPLVPNLVEVGGLHIEPPKPLPQDLKKFMDDAKDGVIYFSLGSNLKSADLPEATRDALLGAFGELKQKVLWKWEADTLPGQTPNVRLSKWWPQADILAHPNTKLFITHGGLLSFEEAVDRGVPLIGIPFYGDQDMNMNRVSSLGVGLKMDFITITKEVALEKINTILKDQSFSRKMKELSARWRDRQDMPLETAVYWTEYVLRHNGANHLKTGGVELAWYQYYLLDLAALVVGTLLVVSFIGMSILCFLLRMCRRKGSSKKETSKSKSSKQKKQN